MSIKLAVIWAKLKVLLCSLFPVFRIVSKITKSDFAFIRRLGSLSFGYRGGPAKLVLTGWTTETAYM